MTGKPNPLVSSFKLSYYTLLNLLRRVEGSGHDMEHVIRNSFQQYQFEQSLPEVRCQGKCTSEKPTSCWLRPLSYVCQHQNSCLFDTCMVAVLIQAQWQAWSLHNQVMPAGMSVLLSVAVGLAEIDMPSGVLPEINHRFHAAAKGAGLCR